MGYGELEKPNVPPDSDLLFDVELLACENDELAELDQTQVQQLAEQSAADEIAVGIKIDEE